MWKIRLNNLNILLNMGDSMAKKKGYYYYEEYKKPKKKD